jgi:hypothetical protein
MDFNTIQKLRGLKASDRTKEEQQAINQQMGYKENPKNEDIEIKKPITELSKEEGLALKAGYDANKVKVNSIADPAVQYYQNQVEDVKRAAQIITKQQDLYKSALADYEEQFGVGRNSVSLSANEFIDNISNEVSSYYKKFHNTTYLPDEALNKKQLAAEYSAMKKAQGEDIANIWLDRQYKDIVAHNQPWWEQALKSVGHLAPSIEGGAIESLGALYGAFNPLISMLNKDWELPTNDNLSWWNNWLNNVLDNPVTRYGRDMELAGASHISDILNVVGLSDTTADKAIDEMKATATKYNPDGLGNDVIVHTNEQDEHVLNSSTPWDAIYSGGFTALSMITGAGLAKGTQLITNGVARGLVALNKANRLIKTEKALEKGLEWTKKAQNLADIMIIPGLTGTTEGLQEGLNTKIGIQQDKISDLNNDFKKLVTEEASSLYNNDKYNPLIEVRDENGKTLKRAKSPEQVFGEVWNKYKDIYEDSMDQIDYASSKAGIHNFWGNSLINGMLNATLKAGLQAPRVQESLRNSKMFGWAYRKPKFSIGDDGVVSPKISKAASVWKVLKEPAGEGLEEYLQSLSNDAFTGAAENNINEFIKAKFNRDSTVKVGDEFSSDWGAALSALSGSLANKESIQSALLGAISSATGTVALPHIKSYHKDDNGNLVKNKLWDKRNFFGGGLKEDGSTETTFDAISRITPWRSSVISAYKERQKDISDMQETAEHLTEWLKDPKNRSKWDGVVGTASWMEQMHNAAESNDQFSYRKAQMGKAINDILMLNKLKGTHLYDTIMTDLQRSASMDVTSEVGKSMIDKMRAANTEELQDKSDEEVLKIVQKNASKALSLMSAVEKEGKYVDRLLGRVDDDTKQSLIYGKIMEQNHRDRKAKLEEEIDKIKGSITSSRKSSNTDVDDDLKSIILTHGSVSKALKEEASLQEKRYNVADRIDELKAINKSDRTEEQKKELEEKEKEMKNLDKALSEFDGLYEKDENGKVMKHLVKQGLTSMVLNEEEIMNLDNRTRAMILAEGANKLYNVTHQNRQRIDALNEEIDKLQSKIDTINKQKAQWTDTSGRVKKGHNKQIAKANKELEKLEKEKFKKLRALNVEQGDKATKPIYSQAQQEVIDNLIEQGTAADRDFLDKVIDLGRIDQAIRSYHQQYQAILSDPNAFNNYVKQQKYKLAIDLTQRRAERIAEIEDFKEFSKELNKLTANASPAEMFTIFDTLKRSNDKKKKEYAENHRGDISTEGIITNYDRYIKNQDDQDALISQFVKNKDLTDNDMSLLVNAMQYLQQEGIDIMDREASVQSLLENDESGNLGGKFRQWVEEKNSKVSKQQQVHMPVFTSIGQVVNQYIEILNSKRADDIDRSNANPTIVNPKDAESMGATVEHPEHPEVHQEDEDRKTDTNNATGGLHVDGEGTPATDATIQAGKEKKNLQNEEPPKTDVEEAFRKVTTLELAKSLNIINNLLDSMVYTEDGKNVGITDEEKKLAKQSLIDIAVNSDEKFNTMDELISAIEEKAFELQNQQDMIEDENNKKYEHASEILHALATRLDIIKNRRKGGDSIVEDQNVSETSSIIHTANIPWMQYKNPGAWAVKFTDDHAIDEFIKSTVISPSTPVYFITNSDWTAEVTRQMSSKDSPRPYDTLSDMPLVAAIEVEAPKNADVTTAIQIGEKWYQPIAVMPSTKSEFKTSGSKRTQAIRNLASKEQGLHIVTDNGMPNGKPLISYIAGKKYIDARHPDDKRGQGKRGNTKENNSDVVNSIIYTLNVDDALRVKGLLETDKAKMLNDPAYRAARERILNRLSWGEGFSGSQDVLNDKVLYTPDDLKKEGGKPADKAQPMMFITKPLSETTARESEKTLPEVLEEGSLDDVVNFNSRTQGLYNNVIRPLFTYMVMDGANDRSAHVITQEDLENDPNAFNKEAERLTTEFEGFDKNKKEETKGKKGLKDFLYISPKSEWSIKVIAPSALQVKADLANSKSVYKVFLINSDTNISPVEIGTITAIANVGGINQSSIESAKELLKNLLKEGTEGVLKDRCNWQVNSYDVKSLNHKDDRIRNKARGNIGNMIDDGIFEFTGSSLEYNNYGLKLKAPISEEGDKIIYPADKITNTSNALPPAPINTTPLGANSVTLQTGAQLDSESGALLQGPTKPNTPQKSQAEANAEVLTKKIVADSKQFILSEDEKYYYIIDKTTGQEIKYLRVTTVKDADDHVGQWYPSVQEWEEKFKKNLSQETRDKLNSFSELAKNSEGHYYNDDRFVVGRRKQLQEIFEKEGISKEEFNKVLAELRTEHKKNKYGGWKTPSTTLGNTADRITRDFFSGELKEHYPNISDDVLQHFIEQLETFRSDLSRKHIKIVSNGVVAQGKVTVTNDDGTTRDVNVAGTLDLFGYDDKGNFYIFDMKTTRNHTPGKLAAERQKWSRQLSLYRDLLMQTYPELNIKEDNLRIIPINVGYETPKGEGIGKSPFGPVYSVTDDGQLQMTYGKDDPKNYIQEERENFEMRRTDFEGQYNPGYSHMKINWDNLSSEDQEIADSLKQQVEEGEDDNPVTPATAEVHVTEKPRIGSAIEGSITRRRRRKGNSLNITERKKAAPIHPVGETTLPSWEYLSNDAKKALEGLGIFDADDYNMEQCDLARTASIMERLKCGGFI